ncbi:OmpH family outer membrane protein [Sphingomonas japonica]|uniref:Skp family chaperone for outer membrane proteins n=1 Tax=Sphingomonas japonica TaxID=511662 RepID=A0ABX0U4Q7_9SPHN|nr:OmpH family outer membrane protein [Sphingomonas japonica]NIJ24784.1 Skp family chaperone for outer membrane proteins [Sphingomonas japonica]
MTISKTLLAALLVAPAALPMAAAAQTLPDVKVAVVDSDRIFRTCTACVAANAQLQQQQQTLRTSAQQLATPLQTEGQAIQAAVQAARGNPDAALQTRITAFEQRQQTAQQQIATQEQTLQRNAAYVRQQIGQRMGPIITQIAQQRGATLALDKQSTFFNAPALEITDAVLASLNSALPSVSVTAPAPQQPAAGTAPAAAAPTTPAPQGR